MESQAILDQFDRQAVWSRGDQRAPHKPLLVLYALGRWARGDQGEIPFGDVNRDLSELFKDGRKGAIVVCGPKPRWHLFSRACY
jgi:putative restriction endonuclease